MFYILTIHKTVLHKDNEIAIKVEFKTKKACSKPKIYPSHKNIIITP